MAASDAVAVGFQGPAAAYYQTAEAEKTSVQIVASFVALFSADTSWMVEMETVHVYGTVIVNIVGVAA